MLLKKTDAASALVRPTDQNWAENVQSKTVT